MLLRLQKVKHGQFSYGSFTRNMLQIGYEKIVVATFSEYFIDSEFDNVLCKRY